MQEKSQSSDFARSTGFTVKICNVFRESDSMKSLLSARCIIVILFSCTEIP